MADSCFKFPDHSLAERLRLTRELEPFSNSSPVESPEDHSDTDLRSPLAKRRKTQEKKIIYVPISGDSSQKCEIPPSDHWAWRKYGQKPIKGSPYPRGYYRCSSSKGCSARKQVERSRIDPSMLIITYTTDHNHICPGPHNSEQRPLQAIANHASQDETSCEPSENLFSCIINSPNATDDLMVNSSSLQVEEEEDSSILQRDVDLCLSRSNTEGEDFFADLGELPELAAIFRKGSLEAHNSEVSHSNIFDWSSSNVLVENNVMS